MLVEWNTKDGVLHLFLLPLGNLMIVLLGNWLLIHNVLAQVIEPLLIAGYFERFQLVRVPVLRIDLFEVALADCSRSVVDHSALLTDKDAVFDLEIC